MYIGVDYYPEHWPRARWDIDARLMQEAGFNVVRLAEFAWAQLEPQEGVFDFDWLDEALGLLHRHGLRAILGTPTGSMPAWVARKYPEALVENAGGARVTWGVRKQNCFSSGAYRLLSERITRALAAHYAAHPAVIGWQTDNEFQYTPCFCTSCRAAFQDWLRARYGTLDALNAAWGTHFWGHCIGTWGEIPIPADQERYPPSLNLDWRRFVSWQNVTFQADQVHILRETCPAQFITHNFMGLYSEIDYYELAADLDVASWDNYPVWGAPAVRYDAAMAADLMRGLRRQNFWIMETNAGPGGWGSMARNPRPGEMRSVAFQAVAHGADGYLWFRWRTCTAGREQYWHGLLGHDGVPGRRYREAAQIARELHRLAPALAGTTTRAEVGILYDYDSLWAQQIQPAFGENALHADFRRYYRPLFKAGVAVDMLPPTGDFSAYKVLIAPQLYVLPDEVADALIAFVQGGGVLIADLRTGVKDATNRCHARVLPGKLREVLGIAIPEYEAVAADAPYPLAGQALPGRFTGAHFAEWIVPEGAETLAAYTPWHVQSYAAATRHRSGQGWGYYVGTVVQEAAFYEALLADALQRAGVAACPLPDGVEAAVRTAPDGARYLFLLNHREEPRDAPVPAGAQPLLGPAPQGETLTLPAFEVAVLRL